MGSDRQNGGKESSAPKARDAINEIFLPAPGAQRKPSGFLS
jgi:hypothetical protein